MEGAGISGGGGWSGEIKEKRFNAEGRRDAEFAAKKKLSRKGRNTADGIADQEN